MCVRERKGHGVVMMKRVLEHTVQDMTDNFLTSVVMVDLTASKIPLADKNVFGQTSMQSEQSYAWRIWTVCTCET